jgi:hypothetical protein
MKATFSNSFRFNYIESDGAPGETRTRDPLLRRQTLYPTELRAHYIDSKIFVPRAHFVLGQWPSARVVDADSGVW